MSEGKRKKISIGVEDFKELIVKNGYFVDKTLMIRDILESNTKVTLFTRPRRFGKTMNQFMLRRFLEDERTDQGEKIENGALFDGLAICSCGEEILSQQQQYPVIFLSLKSGKQPDYGMAYASLVDEIAKEFSRHRYLLHGGILSADEEKRFLALWNRKGEAIENAKALAFLSECLFRYHGRNVILLIDEYDVPLENAYFQGFYDEMIGFLRSLFESALKTNPYLEKGIITGCLRISRESIFTGLNNLEVDTVLNTRYPDSFGFTEKEVREMLGYYGLEHQMPEVRNWYDGYRFGGLKIYNPWSILKYTTDHVDHVTEFPLPYWSNTSSNSIIRELVEDADEDTKRDLERLMDGGCIEKPVHEDITYGDIHESQDNLWNFLFFTGYLKAGSARMEKNKQYLTMSIPNTEVASVYEESISKWFEKRMKATDRSPLIRALEDGDCQKAAELISQQLMNTISYYDYAENYYHGFLTGLLSGAGRYQVESNRESGTGRPDIILKTANILRGKVIILELKVAGSIEEMEGKCREAAAQIRMQRYAEPFEKEGYPEIKKYAVCFYKKDCIITEVK